MQVWVAMSEVTQRAGARARVGWAAPAGAALVVIAVVAAVTAGMPPAQLVSSYALTNLVIGVSLLASGEPVTRATRNPVGPLLVAAGTSHLLSAAATTAAVAALASGWPAALVRSFSTVSTGAWQVGLGLLFPLALLLFPDGQLPGARWRGVAWLIIVSGTFQAATGVLSSGTSFSDDRAADSIVSIDLQLPSRVTDAAGSVSTVAFLLAVAALVRRAVRGDDRTRRQLMWPMLALVIILVLNLQRTVTGDGPVLLLLSTALIPAAMAIAIVRPDLLDIKILLSRTVLYSLTAGLVVLVYGAAVFVVTSRLPSAVERDAIIGAAVIVSVLFAPLRLGLQRGVDRAFYGVRSDSAHAAWRISEDLRRKDDLPGLADRTRRALRLPFLAIIGEPDGRRIAESGTPVDSSAELPLSYRGARVGTLVVGLRRGERTLHPADRQTLELIATPVALALHATTLAEQLRLARRSTVEVATAERMRLQRELHDGVGPSLTSAAYLADAASNLLTTDPTEARRMLGSVRTGLRQASDDIRRVISGLAPVELEGVGLVGAIRRMVATLPTARLLSVHLDLPAERPNLSPAVEVAAHRIVSEALANVLRHSHAQNCWISLCVVGDVVIVVRDDGATPEGWTTGLGLSSIGERAEELGGSATAGPVPGGWEVRASLPLRHPQQRLGSPTCTSLPGTTPVPAPPASDDEL